MSANIRVSVCEYALRIHIYGHVRELARSFAHDSMLCILGNVNDCVHIHVSAQVKKSYAHECMGVYNCGDMCLSM